MRYTLVLLLASISAIAWAQQVRVAAAASVRFPLEEIVAAFTDSHPGTTVSVSYGASGTLFAAIVHGAPFDLFMPAGGAYRRELERVGWAEADTLAPYALGRLTVWAHHRLGLPANASGEEVLTSAAVRRIAVANPEHAPYGQVAVSYLESLGLLELLEPKLVYGENVGQAAQIALQVGEVAIIPLSYALGPELARAGGVFSLEDADSYTLRHESVIVAGRARPEVQAFQAFLSSAPAAAVFKRHGFGLP